VFAARSITSHVSAEKGVSFFFLLVVLASAGLGLLDATELPVGFPERVRCVISPKGGERGMDRGVAGVLFRIVLKFMATYKEG
jgi:hypothetical protein